MSRKRSGKKTGLNISQLLFAGIGVLVVGLIGLNRSDLLKSSQADGAEIAVSEAYTQYQEGVFILDVRTVEEWEAHHIEGATLIPLDQLAGSLEQLPTDEPIVVVCRSGNRSATARDILLAAGFEDVVSMRGGMNDWLASDYPHVTGP